MLSQKGIWWYKYRAKKEKLRSKMSVEMIIRKAFSTSLREYANNASIAGVKQMCDPNINFKQRAIFIIIFCAMLLVVIFFLRHLWFSSLVNPLIVTMKSATYPISEIDFPAVAICNVNRISKKALTREVMNSPLYSAFNNKSIQKDMEWFYLQTGRLLDYTYNRALRNHPFMHLVPIHKKDTWQLIEVMKNECGYKAPRIFLILSLTPETRQYAQYELAPKYEDMLMKCAWAGEVVDCASIFTVRRTVLGHCCAFNYVLSYDSAGQPNETIDEIKRQSAPGSDNGLTVILDPMIEDYAYPLFNTLGVEVLIFDPTHFADPSGGRVIQRTAQPNQAVVIELESIKQVATTEVRKYPISIRKCLFHDERDGRLSKMYSYSACLVNCSIETVQTLCKCTPYYLPTIRGNGAICTLNDLKCLNKYKEKLLSIYPSDVTSTEGLESEFQDSLYCPNCLPDCELTRHFTKYSKIPFVFNNSNPKIHINPFFRDYNMSEKCILKVYQSTTDGVLNRLDVVSYWFEILSNLGGLCGIMLGMSIISLLELIYYIMVRFPAKAVEYYLLY